LLPTSTQPESVPFLLTKAPVGEVVVAEEHEEIIEPETPVKRSVPPHAPPAPRGEAEPDLPSVIVDAAALEGDREAIVRLVDAELEEEAQRMSDVDVDVLLASSDPMIPIHASETTKVSRAPSSRGRGLAIATLVALAAVGGTFVGLRAHGVSARAVGAALHLSR